MKAKNMVIGGLYLRKELQNSLFSKHWTYTLRELKGEVGVFKTQQGEMFEFHCREMRPTACIKLGYKAGDCFIAKLETGGLLSSCLHGNVLRMVKDVVSHMEMEDVRTKRIFTLSVDEVVKLDKKKHLTELGKKLRKNNENCSIKNWQDFGYIPGDVFKVRKQFAKVFKEEYPKLSSKEEYVLMRGGGDCKANFSVRYKSGDVFQISLFYMKRVWPKKEKFSTKEGGK